MPRLKASELRKMRMEELEQRLRELRVELAKLRSASARGTIGKESGKIKNLKRNIARILTVMNERRSKE